MVQLEHTAVQNVIGSIPVRDSDFFFVPCSWQVDHTISQLLLFSQVCCYCFLFRLLMFFSLAGCSSSKTKEKCLRRSVRLDVFTRQNILQRMVNRNRRLRLLVLPISCYGYYTVTRPAIENRNTFKRNHEFTSHTNHLFSVDLSSTVRTCLS